MPRKKHDRDDSNGPGRQRDPRDVRRIERLERDKAKLIEDRDHWKRRSEHLEKELEAARRAGRRQAAPFAKDRPQGRGGRPGRRAGAEYGRQGRRREPTQADETHVAAAPTTCPDCGGAVALDRVASQYQEDLPAVHPLVRRFDIEVGHCSQCQRRVQGRHALQTSDALGAASAQLGPNVAALVVELHTELGMPLEKVVRVLRDAVRTVGDQGRPGPTAAPHRRRARWAWAARICSPARPSRSPARHARAASSRSVALKRPTPTARRLARGLALPEHPPGVLRGAPPARRPTGSRMRPSPPTSPSSTTRGEPPASASPTVAAADRRATAAEDRRGRSGGGPGAVLATAAAVARTRWRVRPGRPHEPGHVDHRRDARGELEDEPDGGRTTRPDRPPERSSRRRPRGRSGGAAERFSRRPAPVLVPPSSFRELPAPWLTMAASAS